MDANKTEPFLYLYDINPKLLTSVCSSPDVKFSLRLFCHVALNSCGDFSEEHQQTNCVCLFPAAEVFDCSPSCSPKAVCKENNTCVCRPFYEGDGFTCTGNAL